MLPEDMVRFIALVDYEPVPALTDDGRSEDLPIKTGDIILVMPGSFSEDSFSVYGQCRGKLGNVLMNFVQVRAVTGCRDRAGRGGVLGTETV